VNINPFPKLVILIAELLILIFLLLPQSLFHSFSCETPGRRLSYESTNGRFIDDQLILIGTPADITQVVTQQNLGVTLTLVENCDLSYLNFRTSPDSNSIVEQRKFVMQLYQTPKGSNIEAIIEQIDASAGVRPIFVDPNYLTRLSDLTTDPCSLPNSGGGGSGGTPYGDPGIPDTEVEIRDAANGFMSQWAFGNQGINLLSSPSVGFAGEEVRVAVFDASPVPGYLPFLDRVGIALPSPLWFTTWNHAGTTMANSHGIFVAGLIHRIAPESDIQVIRVLNDNGCGDLWALNQALEYYKSRMSAWAGDLDKTVINMSLGIRTTNTTNQKDVNTLEELIKYADEEGAIFIAAAGNDSADPSKPRQKMQIPASSKLVLGVAATDERGMISCYSNKGDLAAPGGDGGAWDVEQPDGTIVREDCVSRADTWDKAPGPNGVSKCTDIATCDFGLISLGETRDGPQYMYWAGTSFAAPLVSGMAALAYEEMEKKQVICLLQGGPTGTLDPELGTGIINIGDLTNPTLVPLCP
jgi:hypothetical protein